MIPAPTTTDEELFCYLGPGFPALAESDPERVRRITAEVSEGLRALAKVHKAVSIFGSARSASSHPDYACAVEVAGRLGRAELSIITGGGHQAACGPPGSRHP